MRVAWKAAKMKKYMPRRLPPEPRAEPPRGLGAWALALIADALTPKQMR